VGETTVTMQYLWHDILQQSYTERTVQKEKVIAIKEGLHPSYCREEPDD